MYFCQANQYETEMKTISITPANEAVIPFLKELLSNPAWVSDIVICDNEEENLQKETPPFLCSVDELNNSLCEIEKEFTEGNREGLTSSQMKQKYAV
jgi:hypothetical protein